MSRGRPNDVCARHPERRAWIKTGGRTLRLVVRPAAGLENTRGSTMRDGIAESALGRLRSSSYSALTEVGCICRDGTLELRGQVPSQYLKQIAQALVTDVEGVATVANRIQVMRPRPGPNP